MKYQDAINYINSFLKFGIRPGLGRISSLLNKLDNPQNNLKFVHVAGTNGKGSICNEIAAVLTTAGYKTGLFTSPFVLDFRERFQIDNEMISKKKLASTLQQLIPHIELDDPENCPTEFEIITALAMLYFKNSGCDIVVLETGLGGRFDSTNIIENPLVSVITSISLDHTAVLGNTLSKIAFEKCGIIKNGCPVVSYPLQKNEALEVIKQTTKTKNCSLHIPNPSNLQIINEDIFGSTILYNNLKIHIPLAGVHQIYNTITAIEAILILRTHGINITDQHIINGIASVKFASRCEILSQTPLIILDGAHNADGAKALAKTVSQHFTEKPILIIGMMKDKDYKTALRHIAPICDSMLTVTVPCDRSLTAKELANEVKPFCKTVTATTINKALTLALNSNKPILIAGSLYLASEIRQKVINYTKIQQKKL